MKKKNEKSRHSEKRRDLEKKLLLKSQTLRHLDLAAATGGDGGCSDSASCGIGTCGCTGTYRAPG